MLMVGWGVGLAFGALNNRAGAATLHAFHTAETSSRSGGAGSGIAGREARPISGGHIACSRRRRAFRGKRIWCTASDRGRRSTPGYGPRSAISIPATGTGWLPEEVGCRRLGAGEGGCRERLGAGTGW